MFIKSVATSFVILMILAPVAVRSERNTNGLPVFPLAEGFGVQTPAGRGGVILKVTNLNDSGTGSLRAAVEAASPRLIVFNISGTIHLHASLTITHPFITIAGQTAPSPGITLRGAGISVRTHDVLIQHLRVRVGDALLPPDPSGRDGIQILAPASRVVVDHISASWAIDENGSTWDVSDVTISNSIFSEGLSRSLHRKKEHSKGFLIGDKSIRIAFIGNLLAHNKDRQPVIKAGSSVLHLNNLIYNPGNSDFIGIGLDDEGSGPTYLSAVGNVFYKGPNTPNGPILYAYAAGKRTASGTQFFLQDNFHPDGQIWKGPKAMKVAKKPDDTWPAPLTVRKMNEVESWVLKNTGARPSDRDAVDKRLINEVKTRTGRIIDSPSQVGGWPSQLQNIRPFVVPTNPHGDDNHDGYTNIEELLHKMAKAVES